MLNHLRYLMVICILALSMIVLGCPYRTQPIYFGDGGTTHLIHFESDSTVLTLSGSGYYPPPDWNKYSLEIVAEIESKSPKGELRAFPERVSVLYGGFPMKQTSVRSKGLRRNVLDKHAILYISYIQNSDGGVASKQIAGPSGETALRICLRDFLTDVDQDMVIDTLDAVRKKTVK